ncbi:MAG TPA: TetR/AcrR family transcriptional regulator [Acidimicrobiales bacterium]|nr:TetR/AcrR family transcriptional regulator [Acidimicrobiales bacterium]
MVRTDGALDWRSARRQSARATIVESAWAAVRDEGLAALSLRDLARRSGITTPTVYAYFDSKSDIYDAMFGQAAEEFLQHMAAPYDATDPQAVLAASLRRFVLFCTADLPRYQLLFQRTIPGFEPSPESYAPAVRALELSAEVLAVTGVTDPRHLDVWTALTTGLVSQQIANDPGGDRWVALIEDFVAMFLSYFQQSIRPARQVTKPVRRRP